MKSTFLSDFKAFALKGNVIDMAVGVVIGGAFGKIVSSLVSDVIMPPIGLLVGGVNFKDLSVTLKEATDNAAAVTLNYGAFLQTIIDFLIIAFSIFLLIRIMSNVMRKMQSSKEQKQEAPAPAPQPVVSDEVKLLTEIRDLLKSEKK